MGWLTDRHRKNQNKNVWPDKSLNIASHLNQTWVLHQPEKSWTRQSRKEPNKNQTQCGKWGETNLARARYKKIIIQNRKRSWQEPYTRLILRLTRAVIQSDKSHARRKQSEQENQAWYKPEISLTVQWHCYIITKFVFSSVGLQIFVWEKTVQHTDTQPHRLTDEQNTQKTQKICI